MNPTVLRNFAFIGFIAAWFLPTVVSAQGYNIFKPPARDSGTTPPKIVRHVTGDAQSPIIQGLRRAGDPDQKQNSKALLYFGLVFAVLVCLIAPVLYWQLYWQKRKESELTDPMFLVKELFFVHQLSEPEKKFMLKFSESNALPTPLILFVEPKFLLDAFEDDAYASSHRTVRRLLYKLFEISTDGGGSSILQSKVDTESTLIPPGTI